MGGCAAHSPFAHCLSYGWGRSLRPRRTYGALTTVSVGSGSVMGVLVGRGVCVGGRGRGVLVTTGVSVGVSMGLGVSVGVFVGVFVLVGRAVKVNAGIGV
jgi:hypothetical protein